MYVYMYVTVWATSRTNENMRRRQLQPSQSFTAGMLAKLNSSQLPRHAGDKDWDDQCCWPLLFSYRNSISGSTGDHVAGASAAYENQALGMPSSLHFPSRLHEMESSSDQRKKLPTTSGD